MTEEFVRYKVCKTCGKEKPVSAFYKTNRTPKGRQVYRASCIECYAPMAARRARERRVADKAAHEEFLAKRRSRFVLGSRNEYQKQWRAKRKASQ